MESVYILIFRSNSYLILILDGHAPAWCTVARDRNLTHGYVSNFSQEWQALGVAIQRRLWSCHTSNFLLPKQDADTALSSPTPVAESH